MHALSTQVCVTAELPPGAFFPVPRVVSSFVHVVPADGTALSAEELRRVERVARAAFGQRRKTLANALRGGGFGAGARAAIEAAGADPDARAETLEPEVFRRLAGLLGAS